MAASLAQALDGLKTSRLAEGASLGVVLAGLVDQIEALSRAAEAEAAEQGPAIRDRFARRLGELLEYRDSERQRLAGPGSGLPDNVMPSECYRQRQRLDGKGRDDSHGFECGRDGLGYAEFTECLWGIGRSGRQGLRCGLRCRQPGELRCQGNQLPSVARGLAAHCVNVTVHTPSPPGPSS